MYPNAKFADLLGKTLISVDRIIGDDQIVFVDQDGVRWTQFHCQDCCESVEINDIVGDLQDLVGSPILLAEESTSYSDDNPPATKHPTHTDESYTWTFYKIATIKGSVTIRWYGTSNGYYSESVDFNKHPA